MSGVVDVVLRGLLHERGLDSRFDDRRRMPLPGFCGSWRSFASCGCRFFFPFVLKGRANHTNWSLQARTSAAILPSDALLDINRPCQIGSSIMRETLCIVNLHSSINVRPRSAAPTRLDPPLARRVFSGVLVERERPSTLRHRHARRTLSAQFCPLRCQSYTACPGATEPAQQRAEAPDKRIRSRPIRRRYGHVIRHEVRFPTCTVTGTRVRSQHLTPCSPHPARSVHAGHRTRVPLSMSGDCRAPHSKAFEPSPLHLPRSLC
ncbi:hypothetical protein OBBRIDRAFT_132982 [Obba rivulosa]|uniref:Uncharacterized protein n=1 Tax=Obba rivulosa TaxID=1052685 RepID=A0A8E2DJE4_9APHY|nr:hypothetical protein OBBRIDRAFT_132982 [Obba rivulosa]